METWDAIRSRRDVRQFEDRPIPRDDLELILEAGRRAPSSSNQQRWDFVVVTDRGQLRELSRVWRGAQHVASSILMMDEGAVIEEAPPEQFFSAPEHERTRRFLALVE